jgi:hypothetical protein
MANPPGFGFDASDDLLIVDGIETVILSPQDADGGYSAPITGQGFWEPPTAKNTSGVVSVDRVWHLHAPTFPGVELTRGDLLTAADGTQWVIERASLVGQVDQWQVQTTRAVGKVVTS